MKKMIISVLGKDRPGIIAAVTRILFEQDCNIENVSQTILQNEFSGIFIVGVPKALSEADLHKHPGRRTFPHGSACL
jgi:glycine cleavage system transcriptional repressor